MDQEAENSEVDSNYDGDYKDTLFDVQTLTRALNSEGNSLEFTKFIYKLALEIKKLCKLEKTINVMSDLGKYETFLIELGSFLREMGCPYRRLITDHISSHLQTKRGRLLLIEYLMFDLLIARIVNIDCLKDNQVARMELVSQVSPVANDLKNILVALILKQKPPNITPEIFFMMLENKIKDLTQKEGVQLVEELLDTKALSAKECKSLDNDFNKMYEDYKRIRGTLVSKLSGIVHGSIQTDSSESDNATDSGICPFEEAILRAQVFKLTDFLAIRISFMELEENLIENIQNETVSAQESNIETMPDSQEEHNEQESLLEQLMSCISQLEPELHGSGGRSKIVEENGSRNDFNHGDVSDLESSDALDGSSYGSSYENSYENSYESSYESNSECDSDSEYGHLSALFPGPILTSNDIDNALQEEQKPHTAREIPEHSGSKSMNECICKISNVNKNIHGNMACPVNDPDGDHDFGNWFDDGLSQLKEEIQNDSHRNVVERDNVTFGQLSNESYWNNWSMPQQNYLEGGNDWARASGSSYVDYNINTDSIWSSCNNDLLVSRGRGSGSSRGYTGQDSRGAGHRGFFSNSVGHGFNSYTGRAFSSYPMRFRGNSGYGVDGVRGRGQGRSYHGHYQNRFQFQSLQTYQNNQFLPLGYFHTYQVYTQENNIMYETNNICVVTYLYSMFNV